MLTRLYFCAVLVSFLLVGSINAQDLYFEQRNGALQTFSVNSEKNELQTLETNKRLKTPLGSLWKLFVYVYGRENGLVNAPYTCTGNNPEEVFCCNKGESINEEDALARSCGLYFSPHRLQISQKNWKNFWNKKNVNVSWLNELDDLKPKTRIEVNELLTVLKKVNEFPKAVDYIDKALIKVVLVGTARQSLSELGAFSRIKTFTWDDPKNEGKFIGGFAGWLSDGAVVWGVGSGKSSEYLTRVSPALDKHWKKTVHIRGKQCVTVRYFHDYKIRKVVDLSLGTKALDGVMDGNYRIEFVTGKKIILNSNNKLVLKTMNGEQFIDGKMGINNYIARVLDREVSSKYSSAAEAFSIVIRSYLLERAKKISGCFHVIDSSKFQRVSANIASEKSLAIASKTSGLILNNAASVKYHLDKYGKNMISWVKARGLDLIGYNFQEILKSFYPASSLVYNSGHYSHSCGVLSKANRWLKEKSPRWHKVLVSRPGYERPNNFKVCKLSNGAPFANKKTNEIFVRNFLGFENQYSIAHEYLHLAFKFHPIGSNEKEIDKIAKKLVTLF